MCMGMMNYREKDEQKLSLLKPYTNNDKINNLSIQKKAAFLSQIIKCCRDYSDHNENCNTCPLNATRSCSFEGIKQWLESEA